LDVVENALWIGAGAKPKRLGYFNGLYKNGLPAG